MNNNTIIPGFDEFKDESLKIMLQKATDIDKCLIVVLNGHINTYNSNYFQKQVQKIIDAGYIRLIFHCGSLNHVSSTCFGSFYAFLNAIRPKGGDMVLSSVQPKVQDLFQLLGVLEFFNLKNSLEESVQFFQNAATTGVFPVIFSCPICSKKLKAAKHGRFRCSKCGTILTIDEVGMVSLG